MRSTFRWLKPALLLIGLLLFAALFWRANPAEVWHLVRSLGLYAPLILLPYALVFVLDTCGWWAGFGGAAGQRVSFLRLLKIRWAGEAVNNVIPSGYLGGEAVKVYLLRKRGISGWVGTASVVISKTVQVLAHVLFIALGAALGALHLPAGSPLRSAMLAVSVFAFVAFAGLMGLQHRGFFATVASLARISRRLGRWFEQHRTQLLEVDERIRSFHRREPRWFLLCLASYLAGWLGDSLEVWLVGRCLGWPIPWTQAVAIEAFISVAKALGVFIPASLGIQESGVVLLFQGFGLTSTEALAYALIRRFRELAFALGGLLCLWSEETSLSSLHARVGTDHAENL